MSKYVIYGSTDGEYLEITDGKKAAAETAYEAAKLGFDQEIYIAQITKMPDDIVQQFEDEELDIYDYDDLIAEHPEYVKAIGCVDGTSTKKEVKSLFDE